MPLILMVSQSTKFVEVASVGCTNGASDNTQFPKLLLMDVVGNLQKKKKKKSPFWKDEGGRTKQSKVKHTKKKERPSLFWLNRQAKQ
jgi:hypothetical protein